MALKSGLAHPRAAPGSDCGEQTTEHVQPCGQMHEQIAGMHKIERSVLGKRVADRIMSADLDAITGEPLQQAHVEVERDDRAVSPTRAASSRVADRRQRPRQDTASPR